MTKKTVVLTEEDKKELISTIEELMVDTRKAVDINLPEDSDMRRRVDAMYDNLDEGVSIGLSRMGDPDTFSDGCAEVANSISLFFGEELSLDREAFDMVRASAFGMDPEEAFSVFMALLGRLEVAGGLYKIELRCKRCGQTYNIYTPKDFMTKDSGIARAYLRSNNSPAVYEFTALSGLCDGCWQSVFNMEDA